MKCSRCGSEMKIKNMKTGIDRNGNPIYHKYAVCYQCKIKRDLEKSRDSSSQERKKRKKRKKKKKVLLIGLILFLVVAAASSAAFFYRKSMMQKDKGNQPVVSDNRKNIITPEAYIQIKTGMSLDEVKGIIGSDGNLLTRNTNDNDTTERYQWVTKEDDGTVLLTFSNEKLTSISQTGIDESNISALSENAISSVKPEMSLQEVDKAMGISGVLISETITDGITTATYGWGNQGNGYLYSVVFVDGKAQHVNTPQDKDTNQSTQSENPDSSESAQ